MVSEPNVILGIKQTSLACKEDSHVHTTIRSHTCLSAESKLHGILQPPWLTAVSRSLSPSNPCLSLLDLCTSSLCLMKPTRQKRSMAYCDQNLGTRNPTATALASMRWKSLRLLLPLAVEVLEFQTGLWHTRRSVGLIALWSIKPKKPSSQNQDMRQHAPLGFLASPVCTGGDLTHHPRTVRQLNIMSSMMSAKATLALNTSSATLASHASSVTSLTPCHLADHWPESPGSDSWALTVDFD